MGKLDYDELILLDNFVYLEWDSKEDELFINLIYNLMRDENFPENMRVIGDCAIQFEKSECIRMFMQIINKPNFQNLKIRDINRNRNGVEYACFIDDEDNVTVVFRGTVTTSEWDDNGAGAYEYETQEQIDALNYINSLKYNNITVTGHSKGGNKAQYVAILSSKVSECVAINGQGFSNEFISMYNEEINKNKFKITSVNAKYDYVSCLFNSISGKTIYIKTEIQINPFLYHKANILLDDKGDLRQETSESMFSKIINNFSESIISNLPKDIKYLVVNKFIDIIELILCTKESKDNLLKAIGEILIMFCYENSLAYPEIFNLFYPISEILMLPLLFWNDFVKIEENHSQEVLDNIIGNINNLGYGIVKQLEIVNKNSSELNNQIIKAINDLIQEFILMR